jgi:ATP-dependent Zn protease
MLRLRPRAIALLCVLTLVAGGAALAAAQATESYQVLIAQVDSGRVIRAVVNPPLRHVKVTFRDGSEQEAVYPPQGEPSLLRTLHAHGVTIKFARRPKAKKTATTVHHHLRYIAAAVVGALIVIGGVLLFVSRRRAAAGDEAARTVVAPGQPESGAPETAPASGPEAATDDDERGDRG